MRAIEVLQTACPMHWGGVEPLVGGEQGLECLAAFGREVLAVRQQGARILIEAGTRYVDARLSRHRVVGNSNAWGLCGAENAHKSGKRHARRE